MGEEEVAKRASAPRRSGPEGEAAGARAGGKVGGRGARGESAGEGEGGSRLEARPGARERTLGRPEMGVEGAGGGGVELEGT